MVYLSCILVIFTIVLGVLFQTKVKPKYNVEVDSLNFYKASFDYMIQFKNNFFIMIFVLTHITLIALFALYFLG